jgi:hypothetical protein
MAIGDPNQFTTHMTGDQEVPAVRTPAQGDATFRYYPGDRLLTYDVTITNTTSVVIGINVYEGAIGDPHLRLLARLYSPETCSIGDPNSVHCVGGVEDPDELQQLLPLISEGRALVNVLTTRYPGGEIRGQVR